MFKDSLLVLKCKGGSGAAMYELYVKYKDYLLTTARVLLNDKTAAEDIVHDVFISFAESIEKFELRGSLRSYLAICAVNLVRDRLRAKIAQTKGLDSAEAVTSQAKNPQEQLIEKEELGRLRTAVGELPYEQREVVVLHLKGGLKFKEIASFQDVSISTVHSRYQYGLKKLWSQLNNEMEK